MAYPARPWILRAFTHGLQNSEAPAADALLDGASHHERGAGHDQKYRQEARRAPTSRGPQAYGRDQRDERAYCRGTSYVEGQIVDVERPGWIRDQTV